MKLSTMVPPVLPRAFSTVEANEVSKLSMSNTYVGVSLTPFSLMLPGRTNYGDKLTPVPITTILFWGFKLFCGLGGL